MRVHAFHREPNREQRPPRSREGFRAAVEAFARQAGALAPGALGDGETAFPECGIELLARAGLLDARFATAWAGLEGPPGSPRLSDVLRALRTVGRVSLSLGRLYEGHINALQLIQLFGSDALQTEAERDLAAGRLFAIWNRDAEAGLRLEPQADGRYRLTGAKAFASGAGRIERPLITATLPDGTRQLVLLDERVRDAVVDRTSWRPVGMEASCSFEITFDGIDVDDGRLIGGPDDYVRQPWLGAGAIRFAAVQLGGAERLLELTRTHLRELRRTGDPHQIARVARMAIGIETGVLWLERGADLLDTCSKHPPPPAADRILPYGNMVRTTIEHVALDVMEAAVRSVGASGLVRPHPMEQVVRDLTMYLRQPAPDAAEAVVGRHVLEDDVPVTGLWRT